jgi:biopolymer transport protein ExbB
MLRLIQQGGPIMWPLLLTSVASVAVVLDRIYFLFVTANNRQPHVQKELLGHVESGNLAAAIQTGEGSDDYVVRVLVEGLKNAKAVQGAILAAANKELEKFSRGLSVLDTAITLAPLLGLLATVTGMIHAFGLLGGRELDAPTVITGGIAEALIGTAFGLGIAVLALIPYNFMNARLERARREIEDAATQLELLLKRS